MHETNQTSPSAQSVDPSRRDFLGSVALGAIGAVAAGTIGREAA